MLWGTGGCGILPAVMLQAERKGLSREGEGPWGVAVPCSVPITASRRCTTPGSVPSPRCCSPSAGARPSHACSEQLAAPPVRALLLAQHLSPPARAAVPVPPHGPCPAGTCLRLYSEAFEQRLPPSPAPHVSETSLNRLVLLLKRLDIADMGQCDFLDRPGRAPGGQVWRGWSRGTRWGGCGCGGHCGLGCAGEGLGAWQAQDRVGKAA